MDIGAFASSTVKSFAIVCFLPFSPLFPSLSLFKQVAIE